MNIGSGGAQFGIINCAIQSQTHKLSNSCSLHGVGKQQGQPDMPPIPNWEQSLSLIVSLSLIPGTEPCLSIVIKIFTAPLAPGGKILGENDFGDLDYCCSEMEWLLGSFLEKRSKNWSMYPCE